jgi:hypothetical protein
VKIPKTQAPSEKIEERQCINLYEQVGCVVIKFSQSQRAQQTPGIADLLVLYAKLDAFWWHEVKRRQGPQYYKVQHGQSPHQKIFQENVDLVGHIYILGPLSTAQAYLEKLGIIR